MFALQYIRHKYLTSRLFHDCMIWVTKNTHFKSEIAKNWVSVVVKILVFVRSVVIAGWPTCASHIRMQIILRIHKYQLFLKDLSNFTRTFFKISGIISLCHLIMFNFIKLSIPRQTPNFKSKYIWNFVHRYWCLIFVLAYPFSLRSYSLTKMIITSR